MSETLVPYVWGASNELVSTGRGVGIGYSPANPVAEGAIYVATVSGGGNDATGDGSLESPYRSLVRAAEDIGVDAGGTIYLRGGVYDEPGVDVYYSPFGGTSMSYVDLRGKATALNPVAIRSYPGESAVLDGINHPNQPRSYGDGLDTEWPSVLSVVGEHVELSHLEIKNSTGKGIYFVGNNCHIHDVQSHDNNSDGMYMLGDTILVEDYDGYRNYSINIGGNAGDGIKTFDSTQTESYFGAGATNGNYTILRCRAWLNSDDGFDVWDVQNVTFEYCASFNNGYGPTGNGQGYKLGPSSGFNYITTVKNCLAIRNSSAGFTCNSSTGVTILNSLAYDHPGEIAYDFRDPEADTGGADGNNIGRRNISYIAQYLRSPVTPDPFIIYEDNTWDLSITGPLFISEDPSSPDFLKLSDGSPCRNAARDGSDLGPIPYGGSFPVDLSVVDLTFNGSVPT